MTSSWIAPIGLVGAAAGHPGAKEVPADGHPPAAASSPVPDVVGSRGEGGLPPPAGGRSPTGRAARVAGTGTGLLRDAA